MKKSTASDPRNKAKTLLEIILDKHPQEPLVLDLRGSNFIWDFFVIVTAGSGPHARAMVDELIKVSKDRGFAIHHTEIDEEAGWFLIDYTDVCFHVFSKEKRDFYRLERLFKGAKKTRFRFKGHR